MSGIRLLVCGNRDWSCVDTIAAWMRPFRKRGPVTVIHGAAMGADTIAGQVALAMGYEIEEYPADWDKHGKRAGPIRNREMFERGKPHRGLAFGRLTHTDFSGRVHLTGTGDMVTVMNAGGIIVTVVPRAGMLP